MPDLQSAVRYKCSTKPECSGSGGAADAAKSADDAKSSDDARRYGSRYDVSAAAQLDGGTVTLWFASDSCSWDEATLTYTDGVNSVTVSGVTDVTLRFGEDTSLPAGCFDDAVSEKIFEDKNKGFLA